MNSPTKIRDGLFHPISPILLYLFMSITTLHEKIDILTDVHFELLVIAWVLLSTVFHIVFMSRENISYRHSIVLPLLLGFLFIIGPMVTTLVNQDVQELMANEEYKTQVKMILFGPCLFWLMIQERWRDFLLNFLIGSYCILGCIFLYRYRVLGEVREFDLRPLLKMRNGDSNFLCTFFSMMIPLSLMQAWKMWEKRYYQGSFVFFVSGFFLLFCAFLTESRMGLIAIFIGGIYLLTSPVWTIATRSIFVAMFSLILLIMVVGPSHALQRFSELGDKSNSDRILTWINGWKVFQENPWFGSGIHEARNFFYANTKYPSFQSEFKPLEVHNTFLAVAAEWGTVGFFCFMMLFLWPWKQVVQRTSPDRYFLISSLLVLTMASMSVGIGYKDLFVLHLFVIASLASETKKELLCS